MEEYIVFIRIDSANRITDVNSSEFVNADWGIEIDRGSGDRFHHAQGNYFSEPLYTEDGICQYKYEAGFAKHRTDEEIEHDRQSLPDIPSEFDRLESQVLFTAMMTDTLL